MSVSSTSPFENGGIAQEPSSSNIVLKEMNLHQEQFNCRPESQKQNYMTMVDDVLATKQATPPIKGNSEADSFSFKLTQICADTKAIEQPAVNAASNTRSSLSTEIKNIEAFL